jgi:hypothetical protein
MEKVEKFLRETFIQKSLSQGKRTKYVGLKEISAPDFNQIFLNLNVTQFFSLFLNIGLKYASSLERLMSSRWGWLKETSFERTAESETVPMKFIIVLVHFLTIDCVLVLKIKSSVKALKSFKKSLFSFWVIVLLSRFVNG